MKKGGFMKDAVVLFAITLIAGVLLGIIYQVTKTPIELATIAANNKAYKSVFSEAQTFEEDESLISSVEQCNEELTGLEYGNVAVVKALKALDEGGNQVGYVITSQSKDSYGGLLKLSVGFKTDGSITGVAFLEISDTPGLGLKAKEPKFKDQYTGKSAESLKVVKMGGGGEDEINAISGATITSKASTNAVNAALYFLHNFVELQEVGA